MNTTRLSLLTIAAALALAGCGNKGPLVLPEAPDEAQAPATVDETDVAPMDQDPADDGTTGDSIAEPVDDTDAPTEPEPLPQDGGDGG